jgi:hypothetical protein
MQMGENEGKEGASYTKSDRVPMIPPHSAHSCCPVTKKIVQSERGIPDPLVPTPRDESESKELTLVLFSIRLMPFLIPRIQGGVRNGHRTYVREWENDVGHIGENGVPGEVGSNEDMKGEVQSMEREGAP